MTINLINELSNIPEVELVYSVTKERENKKYINYTVIMDTEGITSDLTLLKKVLARLELLKTLMLNSDNIIFNYHLKTSKAFTEDIENRHEATVSYLKEAEVLYSNNDYFNDYIDAYKTEKNKKAR